MFQGPATTFCRSYELLVENQDIAEMRELLCAPATKYLRKVDSKSGHSRNGGTTVCHSCEALAQNHDISEKGSCFVTQLRNMGPKSELSTLAIFV